MTIELPTISVFVPLSKSVGTKRPWLLRRNVECVYMCRPTGVPRDT